MAPDDARAATPDAGSLRFDGAPGNAERAHPTAPVSFLDADSLARWRTTPGAPAGAVRIGFVFGPRALRRTLGRPVEVVRATGVGTQRTSRKVFADAGSLARFCVRELNASLRRARVAARVCAGAVSHLAEDESVPYGPYPGARLVDALRGRVLAGGTPLPLECWALTERINAVLVLLDWRMFRSRIQRGDWAGFAPAPAMDLDRTMVFHPVAVVDITCALSAHTLAHEFGHVLGCSHESEPGRVADYARAFTPPTGRTFGVMAAGRPDERGRRLEWSRPRRGGGAWRFGDAVHDEARWLGAALPQLARQRFACHGLCGGDCPASRADVRTPLLSRPSA